SRRCTSSSPPVRRSHWACCSRCMPFVSMSERRFSDSTVNRARTTNAIADMSCTHDILRATLRFGYLPDATRDDTSRRASDARATVDAGNASGTTVILVQVNASRARTRRRIACSVLQRANPSRDGDAKLPLLGDRRGGRAAEALRTRLRSLRLVLWRRPRDKAVAREDRPCLVI